MNKLKIDRTYHYKNAIPKYTFYLLLFLPCPRLNLSVTVVFILQYLLVSVSNVFIFFLRFWSCFWVMSDECFAKDGEGICKSFICNMYIIFCNGILKVQFFH